MVYQTESKVRGWRAVAVFANGRKCLVYLGRSTTQVRNGYIAAYLALLDDEEQRFVKEITLECWQGAADAGRWIRKSTLAVPSRATSAATEDREHASGVSLSPSTTAQGMLPGAANVEVLPFPEPSGKTENGHQRTRAVRVS